MSDSVVNLDPISARRKKQDGLFNRIFKTRHFSGGKKPIRTDSYGHYLFAGKQRSGKSSSALWYLEFLVKKYTKRKKTLMLYSNLGIGGALDKFSLHELICNIDYNPDIVYVFIVDEIQSYYPKDTKDKVTLSLIDSLTGDFSQLAKKQIYVLSTAQVYGRVHKNLREQCLYLVDCRRSFFGNLVNDFIQGDDIVCDDLGRWSGVPDYIYVHKLPITRYNTHRMIVK